ncbi:hypothetical protein HNQ39_004764 [Armatimonas rosea]|uniref:Uncharacterized protein n=1 Tax=Armatimonas rosea TaxID=685828 RepID=A0A7W9SU88_ARMRO|nr:hypothetical protein [Armatimonas rosea]
MGSVKEFDLVTSDVETLKINKVRGSVMNLGRLVVYKSRNPEAGGIQFRLASRYNLSLVDLEFITVDEEGVDLEKIDAERAILGLRTVIPDFKVGADRPVASSDLTGALKDKPVTDFIALFESKKLVLLVREVSSGRYLSTVTLVSRPPSTEGMPQSGNFIPPPPKKPRPVDIPPVASILP